MKQIRFLMLIGILNLVMPSIAVSDFWTENTNKPVLPDEDLRLSLFSNLVEKLSPSVVNIRALEKIPIQSYPDYPSDDFPSSRNGSREDGFRARGEGSGFIFNYEGYILTNAHVISGSDVIQVGLKDGQLYRAKVIGIDEAMDIGLIKIDTKEPLPVLPLGHSSKLKIGEWVMAIGSPFGLEQTVTVGIVSAKKRSLGYSNFDDFIQIDAPINPGNSGGPLINTRGEVVGINTMVLSRGQGLGFSLPIDLVKKVLPELKKKGKVERSWLGVVIREITIDIKELLKLPIAHGAYIVQIVKDSPAQKAGLKEGDVVTEFNGTPIATSRELPMICAHTPSNQAVPIKIFRKGKEIELEVTLVKVSEHSSNLPKP